MGDGVLTVDSLLYAEYRIELKKNYEYFLLTCLYCIKNWQLVFNGLLRNDLFILHLSVYITFTNTPWYVSRRPGLAELCRPTSGISKGISVTPTGILPAGASSNDEFTNVIGCNK